MAHVLRVWSHCFPGDGVLLRIACVCLDKFLKLSDPPFSSLQSVDSKRIKLNKLVKCWEQFLAHRSCQELWTMCPCLSKGSLGQLGCCNGGICTTSVPWSTRMYWISLCPSALFLPFCHIKSKEDTASPSLLLLESVSALSRAVCQGSTSCSGGFEIC